MDEDEDLAHVVVSSPFTVPDAPADCTDARAAARMHRGEVYARRGLLVGAEAVSLDVNEHDYIAAYLYYCSAIKILVASLKETGWTDKEGRALVNERSRDYLKRAEMLSRYNRAVRELYRREQIVLPRRTRAHARQLVEIPLARRTQPPLPPLPPLLPAPPPAGPAGSGAGTGPGTPALGFGSGGPSTVWDVGMIARLVSRGIYASLQAVGHALAWTARAYGGQPLHTLDAHKTEIIGSLPPNVPFALVGDHGETFEYVDHRPVLYALLRSTAMIPPADFLRSFTAGPLVSMRATGRSRSFFFTTQDKRYIVKTINPEEHECLSSIEEDYYTHMNNVAASLLVRFFSHFTLRLHGTQCDLHSYGVIMENIFPVESSCIAETYDLKGSTYKREATEKEKRRLDKVLKDIDLKKGPRHAFRLSPSRRALLVHAIEDDSEFLEQHHIMDYSMLIGVKRRGLSEEEELRSTIAQDDVVSYTPFRCDEGGFATADLADCQAEILFLGIIDILQPYNTRKKVERTFKQVFTGGKQEISSEDPAYYGKRFRRFLRSVIVENDDTAGVAGTTADAEDPDAQVRLGRWLPTDPFPAHPPVPTEPPPLPRTSTGATAAATAIASAATSAASTTTTAEPVSAVDLLVMPVATPVASAPPSKPLPPRPPSPASPPQPQPLPQPQHAPPARAPPQQPPRPPRPARPRPPGRPRQSLPPSSTHR